MRRHLAARLRERFGIDTIEFYAGTAHRAILADAAGDAPGSLGVVLPGSAEVALVGFDLATRAPLTDPTGHLVAVREPGEPGLLAVRLSAEELETLGDLSNVVKNAFRGDPQPWLVTTDVLARDTAGKHWFVDALGAFVSTSGGPVSLRSVEDALYAMPEVRVAAAWESGPGQIEAAFVSSLPIGPERLRVAIEALPLHARPEMVARLEAIDLTEGFRASKRALREHAGAATERWQPGPGTTRHIRPNGS